MSRCCVGPHKIYNKADQGNHERGLIYGTKSGEWSVWRYGSWRNSKANSTPTKLTENDLMEISPFESVPDDEEKI